MRFLDWTEKQVIQNMIVETLERAFDKEESQGIYFACSEAVFNEVEQSEWFQDGKDILVERIRTILGAFIEDSLRFRFEGEHDY